MESLDPTMKIISEGSLDELDKFVDRLLNHIEYLSATMIKLRSTANELDALRRNLRKVHDAQVQHSAHQEQHEGSNGPGDHSGESTKGDRDSGSEGQAPSV
jgi:hypothetical protein